MDYITLHFIKYNKIFYMLYTFLIMLLFNTYATTTYCEEGLENINEKIIKQNTTNTFTSFAFFAVISVTALCVAYSLTAYCFPDLDTFNLFHDNFTPTFSNYGLNSIITDKIIEKQTAAIDMQISCDKIVVDKPLFDHITKALEKHRQININLLEDTMQKDEQLKNLYQLLDLMSPTFSNFEQKQIRRNSI